MESVPPAKKAEAVVPKVSGLPTSAAEEVLKRHSLAPVKPASGDGAFVTRQSPPPGTGVAAGTRVTVSVGQPQLILSANRSRAEVNQDVTFSLVLDPQPPSSAGFTAMAYVPPTPKYTFNWGDGSFSNPSDVRAATHRYVQAGQFQVSASAELGKSRIPSNQVTVVITDSSQNAAAYQVSLVLPPAVEVGQQVRATAFVDPEPGNRALYSFVWGDGQTENQASPSATHTYSAPAATRYVSAVVNVNGRQIHSNPTPIRILEPPSTGGSEGQNPITVTETPPATDKSERPNPTATGTPSEVVVPPLYWLTSEAANVVLRKNGLAAEPPRLQNGVVISQNPEPGDLVPHGSTVSYTLGQPELSLSANDTSPKVNENVSFTVTLEPRPPQHFPATYTFNWGDGSAGTQGVMPGMLTAAHSFHDPGTYNVSAVAQFGEMSIPSREVTVAVQGATPAVMYTVSVQVSPSSAETGQSVYATASISPAPVTGASYTFIWGDGSSQAVPQQSAEATHSYSLAKTYIVQVIANVGGGVIRSNPAHVEVTLPTSTTNGTQPTATSWAAWQIAVAVGIALLVVSAGLKLMRRPPRPSSTQQTAHAPESLSITSGPGLSHHVIQHAEQLGKMPSVRVRAGCTSRVAVTSPQAIIKKKRSTSNA